MTNIENFYTQLVQYFGEYNLEIIEETSDYIKLNMANFEIFVDNNGYRIAPHHKFESTKTLAKFIARSKITTEASSGNITLKDTTKWMD